MIISGWTKTLIFIVLAPVIGLILGLLLMVAISWVCRPMTPGTLESGNWVTG